MKITIETIPHAAQRYPTAGDWWLDGTGNLQIRVSRMDNWKYEALVAFHELAEALLCLDHDIPAEVVDAFDKAWHGPDDAEPGDDPASPYREEHFFATTVERLLCAAFDLDWLDYGEAVAGL